MMKMKMMKLVIVLSCLLAFAASSAMAATKCRFEIVVKTGNRDDAGTDARVSLRVRAARGSALVIPNLESWGQMPANNDYFEKGHLDRFGGRGTCMPSEPCFMTIRSDGSGGKPGWYVEYVEVTQLAHGRVPSMTHKWNVNQWLADDEPPNRRWADRDGCGFA